MCGSRGEKIEASGQWKVDIRRGRVWGTDIVRNSAAQTGKVDRGQSGGDCVRGSHGVGERVERRGVHERQA